MTRPCSPGLLRLVPALVAIAGLVACGGDSTTSTTTSSTATGTGGAGGGSGGDGGSGGSGGSAPNKAADCSSTFGTELTSAFGRLDGVVTAVVKPVDQQCKGVNGDHVVIEAKMNGAVYRLVVNIQSDFGDPQVRYLALDHALPPPAWAEGWHTGLVVDYVATFGVHAGVDFKPYPLAQLADIVTDAIPLGQKISVYAESSGGPSAHKVHRNTGKTDGAIVLDPEGTLPRVLLFHFSTQNF
ncbi:MAG: hypothetical protein ACMG6S_07295 [Byssovorax sp.]